MGESSSKELQEEEMEKLQKAIDHNQNMTFSNICSSVREAIAAIDVALDDFAEWICKRLNLDEVPAYTEYEYMMLERIQKELEVVNSSLTRFNTDVKQFLVKEGWAIMAIKARSIDVRKSPLEVYEREVEVLKQSGFTIEELVHLGPFEKDHAIAVAKFHAF